VSRRRATAVLLAAALILAGCGGGESHDKTTTARTTPIPLGPPAPPRAAGFFGMNAQRLPPRLAAGQTAQVNRSLAEMRALGVSFVRATVDWQTLEPNPPRDGVHSYRFDALDAWVSAVSANGLRWQILGIGSPSPTWAMDPAALAAGCDKLSPPRPTAYAAMMAALARRYGQSGSFWKTNPQLPYRPSTNYEVWNEPNSGFWCPRPDPAAYALLYLDTRTAIRAVDPKAVTLLGGLAPFHVNEPPTAPLKMGVRTFLSGALRAQPRLRTEVDAVAIHPYGMTGRSVLNAVAWFRKTLNDVGLRGVPMSANEFGWPTSGVSPQLPPVTEAQRARYLPTATTSLARSNCGLIGLAPHTWVTEQRNPASIVDWYGLANPATGQPYSSALAYGRAVKSLEDGGSGRTLEAC
jgi:hypothetical protein